MRGSGENGGGAEGFGLAEALVVLVLAGLVLAVAVPLTLDALRASRRDAAARRVLADLRVAQSLAAARSAVFVWQWGPDAGRAPSEYRLVRDAGGCSLPAAGHGPDGVEVVRGWFDLARAHAGMTVRSVQDDGGRPLGAVMFDAMGASVNPCSPGVSFPVRVTLADDRGATRVIVVRRAGGTSLQ